MGDYTSLKKLEEMKANRESIDKRISDTKINITGLQEELKDLYDEFKTGIKKTGKEDLKVLESIKLQEAELQAQERLLKIFNDEPYDDLIGLLDDVIEEMRLFNVDLKKQSDESVARFDKAIETYNQAAETEDKCRSGLMDIQRSEFDELLSIVDEVGTNEQRTKMYQIRIGLSGTHLIKKINTYNMTMK